MIRLIRRRLIIPRGDTGSFSIPTIGTYSEGDIAVLGIFDPLTHETVVLKATYITHPSLTFTFKSSDTIDLEPKKYNWDITLYNSPQFDEDGELIGAAETNSYYSAFKLPVCEIKEVALDMRRRTRDLLLEAQNPSNPTNYIERINAVYPWENSTLSFLAAQLFTLAQANGYDGDAQDFSKKIVKALEGNTVFYNSLNDFPSEGEKDKLYFDTVSHILYYWDGSEYQPVNTNLIDNTIIQGGIE